MPSGSSYLNEIVCTDGSSPTSRWTLLDDGPAPAFSATRRHLVVPEGGFIDLRMAPTVIGRTAKQCQADAVDDIILSLVVSGGGGGWFNDSDQATRLSSGSLFRIRDDSRPYVLQWSGSESHTLHLEIPRTSFDRRTRDRILAAAGRHMPPHGLVPMLIAQMHALAAAAPGLDSAAGAAGVQAALVLATAMLRLAFGADAPDGESCEDGMLVAAKALICRRFGSLDLSPEEIAHRLGCSRAHLYRVFARNGLTIAGYLREIRLERCRAALAAASKESIGDIAFRCGFDNPVYFADLFRRRYGMRPKDARAQAQQPEHRFLPETPTGDF